MDDINKLIEKYNEIKEIPSDFEELSYLDAVAKIKDWQIKSDNMKLICREQSYRINKKIENSKIIHKYEYSAYIFLKKLLIYLEENKLIIDANYSLETIFNKAFFKIYTLLYCEKELILYTVNLRGVRNHIPPKIYLLLIDKIKNTEDYKKYKLDELFEAYKKMYDLFLEKPYENS